MSKWIDFIEMPSPGVTKRWRVATKPGGSTLGVVRWYSGWRRYVFAPMPGSEYEQDCLRDIAAFIETHTLDHKEARAALKGAP